MAPKDIRFGTDARERMLPTEAMVGEIPEKKGASALPPGGGMDF